MTASQYRHTWPATLAILVLLQVSTASRAMAEPPELIDGIKALNSGAPDQAVVRLTSVIQSDQRTVRDLGVALHHRAKAYVELKQPVLAIADINSALWLGSLSRSARADALRIRSLAKITAGLPAASLPPLRRKYAPVTETASGRTSIETGSTRPPEKQAKPAPPKAKNRTTTATAPPPSAPAPPREPVAQAPVVKQAPVAKVAATEPETRAPQPPAVSPVAEKPWTTRAAAAPTPEATPPPANRPTPSAFSTFANAVQSLLQATPNLPKPDARQSDAPKSDSAKLATRQAAGPAPVKLKETVKSDVKTTVQPSRAPTKSVAASPKAPAATPPKAKAVVAVKKPERTTPPAKKAVQFEPLQPVKVTAKQPPAPAATPKPAPIQPQKAQVAAFDTAVVPAPVERPVEVAPQQPPEGAPPKSELPESGIPETATEETPQQSSTGALSALPSVEGLFGLGSSGKSERLSAVDEMRKAAEQRAKERRERIKRHNEQYATQQSSQENAGQ